jgi:hypothetical protein
MRELNICEISYVGGGDPPPPRSESSATRRARENCRDAPDSTNTTVTNDTPDVTFMGFGLSSDTGDSTTFNCGDLNRADFSGVVGGSSTNAPIPGGPGG